MDRLRLREEQARAVERVIVKNAKPLERGEPGC